MQKNDRTTLFKKLDVGVCWVGILIALVGCVYIVKNMKAIMHPNFSISSFECVLAILILLLVLDCARRSIGMAIPIMAIIAIGYAMFGKYIPGTWGHNGITFRNLLTTLVYSDRGVWGSITGTSATIIATFVIFGSVLFSTGGGQTFIDAANALTGGDRRCRQACNDFECSVRHGLWQCWRKCGYDGCFHYSDDETPWLQERVCSGG